MLLLCLALFMSSFVDGGYSQGVNSATSSPPDCYLQFGGNTDPGELGYLYNSITTDLTGICKLIKQQLIHPTRIKDFPELSGLEGEDTNFYSVRDMLAELLKRNPRGLVQDRAPAERLRVSCRFHALLLVSILRAQGIPSRVRVGFASYLSPPGLNKSIDHWICEVWDRQRTKWILVDPDLRKIDFDRSEFDFAGDVWLRVQNHGEDPSRYGVARWWGKEYIKANVIHDLSCVLNTELIYREGPLLSREGLSAFTASDFSLLNEVAQALGNVDNNLEILRQLHKDSRLGSIVKYQRYR
jgi:hypothetical protein